MVTWVSPRITKTQVFLTFHNSELLTSQSCCVSVFPDQFDIIESYKWHVGLGVGFHLSVLFDFP